MKPGATTRPSASISLFALSLIFPISTIFPARARRGGGAAGRAGAVEAAPFPDQEIAGHGLVLLFSRTPPVKPAMASVPRRVAILGGARIPFARAGTAYGEASNQDMLTAV